MATPFSSPQPIRQPLCLLTASSTGSGPNLGGMETSCWRSHSAIARSYHPHRQYAARRGPVGDQSGAAAMELRLMETCISSCGVARRTTPVAASVQRRCHVMTLSPASLPPESFFVYCRKHQTIDGFLSVLSRGSRSHATQRPTLRPISAVSCTREAWGRSQNTCLEQCS